MHEVLSARSNGTRHEPGAVHETSRADAAFVQRALHPAKGPITRPVGVKPVRRSAVVRAEHNERVAVHAPLFQRRDDSTNSVVQRSDHAAERAALRPRHRCVEAVNQLLRRLVRRVNRLVREIHEQWLRLDACRTDHGLRPFGEDRGRVELRGAAVCARFARHVQRRAVPVPQTNRFAVAMGPVILCPSKVAVIAIEAAFERRESPGRVAKVPLPHRGGDVPRFSEAVRPQAEVAGKISRATIHWIVHTGVNDVAPRGERRTRRRADWLDVVPARAAERGVDIPP